MKKNVFILLIISCILIIFTSILSAEEIKYDFRQTTWGMSKEQVKATEDKKPGFEDDTALGYDVMISGKDFLCNYFFVEDKLYRSIYSLSGKHTNKNLYIDDYEELKEILTKKYDKPKIDKIDWKNDLYKDDKSDWGMAISIGHLVYIATWETPTTIISLALYGDNYKIRLGIGYESKKLKEWANKINVEKAKEDF